MRGSSSWRVAIAALAASLALPAAAAAEPVSTLGQGRLPSAVTDATGTLHAVWNVVPAGSSQNFATGYCRLPPGAAACTPITLAQPTGAEASRPHILFRPADGALFVVAGLTTNGTGTTYLWSSGDGGTTWAGPTAIGTLADVAEAQLTADGTAVDLLGPYATGLVWQRAPLGGGQETRSVGLLGGTKYGLGEAIGLSRLPDGRTVVLGSDGPGSGNHTALRTLDAADPYQPTSWSAWKVVPSVPGTAAGAGAGPSGTWLMNDFGVRLRVRRWQAGRFSAPRTMGTLAGVGGGDVGDNGTPPYDLGVDLAGRVHVVWVPHGAQCGPANCFAYRRSEPYGFGPTFTYPVATRDGATPTSLIVAANAGGSGWIVWGDQAFGPDGTLRAAPLVTPPRYSRTGSKVLGHRRRVTLPVRRGCIRPGSRFVHHLDLSGLRGDVRIVSVRFFFDDGQLARVDRRAPYRVVYKLAFAPLSRHVAAARVSYRSGGRLRHATVGRMIVMCPA